MHSQVVIQELVPDGLVSLDNSGSRTEQRREGTEKT
jgi:hypothetical protein